MLRAIKDFTSSVGTSITVLSHGKIALNPQMASAIRNGLDVKNPEAFLVVNIGKHTTDIVVIKKKRILSLHSISISMGNFIEDVILYIGCIHNMRINEPVAERILAAVGAVLPELTDAPKACTVVGPNKLTALPMQIKVSHEEISHCLRLDMDKLSRFIQRVIEAMPLDWQGQIFRQGIFFIGAGTILRGLDTHFETTLNIPCHTM